MKKIKKYPVSVPGFLLAMRVAEKQPTAYDVEKVVAELEEEKNKIAKSEYCKEKNFEEFGCDKRDCFVCCAEHLIDIIRNDGKE